MGTVSEYMEMVRHEAGFALSPADPQRREEQECGGEQKSVLPSPQAEFAESVSASRPERGAGNVAGGNARATPPEKATTRKPHHDPARVVCSLQM